MNRITLPFTTDVEIKAYQNKAFALGAIKATIKDYDTWLCNTLIECAYYTNGRFDMYNYLWNSRDDLITNERLDLYSGILDHDGSELIALNKRNLKEGMYINGYYNEFYIKGKGAYQQFDFSHDYVIFGYDDEKRVFKSASYLADQRYQLHDIDYDSYYSSIIHNDVKSTCLFYRKIKACYTPKIDIEHIKTEMLHYINSSREIPYEGIVCFGLNAWDKFREYVKITEEPMLDYRYSRVFMEHKAIMRKRLKRLWELGFLPDDFSEEYSIKVCSPAQITHHLFIKYNMTSNADTHSNILQMIQKANECEADILGEIVNKYL